LNDKQTMIAEEMVSVHVQNLCFGVKSITFSTYNIAAIMLMENH